MGQFSASCSFSSNTRKVVALGIFRGGSVQQAAPAIQPVGPLRVARIEMIRLGLHASSDNRQPLSSTQAYPIPNPRTSQIVDYHPIPPRMVASHGGSEEPPPFNLTDIDRAVLASTDEEFHLQTWEDLKVIIGTAPPNETTEQKTHGG
jgi:hypothetical protein